MRADDDGWPAADAADDVAGLDRGTVDADVEGLLADLPACRLKLCDEVIAGLDRGGAARRAEAEVHLRLDVFVSRLPVEQGRDACGRGSRQRRSLRGLRCLTIPCRKLLSRLDDGLGRHSHAMQRTAASEYEQHRQGAYCQQQDLRVFESHGHSVFAEKYWDRDTILYVVPWSPRKCFAQESFSFEHGVVIARKGLSSRLLTKDSHVAARFFPIAV